MNFLQIHELKNTQSLKFHVKISREIQINDSITEASPNLKQRKQKRKTYCYNF